MQVCIIVFSPSGHSLSVAKMMKETMESHKMTVQLLNVTGEKKIFKGNDLKKYLDNEVEPHDLLCIGGPVYAGHLESNVKKIIRALPDSDRKWGELAIPFVTYGGIHSSIALKEAGDLLYKGGRKNIMGMKIACFHTLTTRLSKQINQGKPSEEAKEVVAELVCRIGKLGKGNKGIDTRKYFSYTSIKEKIIFNILSQDFFHKNYRSTEIDSSKCIGCGLCISNCPINLIELKDSKAVVRNASRCILCAECYHNCPRNAVKYAYYSKVKERLEKTSKLELPQSAVYPRMIR